MTSQKGEEPQIIEDLNALNHAAFCSTRDARAQAFPKIMDIVDEVAKIDRQAAFSALCETSIFGDPVSKLRATQKPARFDGPHMASPWPTDDVVASSKPLRPEVGVGHPFLYGGTEPAAPSIPK